MIANANNGPSNCFIIKESFLDLQLLTRMVLPMSNQIIKSRNETNIPLSKYQGHTLDGANTMKGLYKGVQSLIKDNEPNAVYVLCHGYTLNLVVKDDVIDMQRFFETVQQVHTLLKMEYCIKIFF